LTRHFRTILTLNLIWFEQGHRLCALQGEKCDACPAGACACISSQNEGDAIRCSLLPVNAAIQSLKQLRSLDREGVTNSKQCRECNWPSRLDLLPMASGKPKSNHVFLGEPRRLSQSFYSLPEGAEELFIIDQACFLGDSWLDNHEQISWTGS